MELPKRKQIRLLDYDYKQNGAYFVTICTHNHQCLFGTIVGVDAHIDPNASAKMMLSEYGIVVEKYIQRINGIEKYVIMPNHVHLIIGIDERVDVGIDPYIQSLSQRIQSLKILVTKEIGVKIWQRSYHEHIIRNQKSYEEIWQYIDTNPLKWKLDKYHSE